MGQIGKNALRGVLATIATVILIFGTPAHADLIFDLTVDACSGSCGPSGSTFGTITLSEVDSATVHVDVDLSADFTSYFVNTGAGYALTWDGPTTENVTNLSDGFSFLGFGTYDTGGDFGTFHYAINCDVGGACGHGASNSTVSSFAFDVSHTPTLALSDFFPTNPEGFYFTVDLLGPNGNTGVVGANTSHTSPECIPGTPDCSPDCVPGTPNCTPPTVPEPGTLALIAIAMVGGALGERRRRTAKLA